MSTSGLHMHAHTCASLTTYEFIYKKRKNGRKEERKVGRQASWTKQSKSIIPALEGRDRILGAAS